MALVATLMAVSCNKEEKPKKDDKKDKEDVEYIAPITIDGQFADWAKLDASKVATATSVEGADKDALKLVKVYADELYVYIYFEWDTDLVESDAENDEQVPFHVYINGDNDTSTGGFADQFEDACMDLLLEGFLFDSDDQITAYDPECFKWCGEVNGSGWDNNWEDIDSPAGFVTGAGVNGKYEMSICRELYPAGKMATDFSIGFDIQQGWDSVGVLPNAAEGNANSLPVVTVK